MCHPDLLGRLLRQVIDAHSEAERGKKPKEEMKEGAKGPSHKKGASKKGGGKGTAYTHPPPKKSNAHCKKRGG